jgi:hypothetical protein
MHIKEGCMEEDNGKYQTIINRGVEDCVRELDGSVNK